MSSHSRVAQERGRTWAASPKMHPQERTVHRLIILGKSGNAGDILDIVKSINRQGTSWYVKGLLDDTSAAGTKYLGLDVLGPLSSALDFGNDCVFLNAIGSDKSYRQRSAIVSSMKLSSDRFATLVHPQSSISTGSKLGHGVCAGAGVCVARNVSIGEHVWLGAGCIIGHDTVIGDHCVVAPGAVISGFVRVGSSCYLGAHSVIRQGLEVGNMALVGMGAVVTRNVPLAETVTGNPARRHTPANR